jgi:hypothetical protein
MDLEDINFSSPRTMEGPVIDVDDVIDTELSKTAKMEIDEDGNETTNKGGDALFRDGDKPSQSGRFSVRQYLIATVGVTIGLIVLIVAISLSAASNGKGGSSSSQNDIGGRSPIGDIESTGSSYVCPATKSSCPANATKNNWAQVSQDVVGEAGDDLAGAAIAMSCDGSIMAIGAPNNRYAILHRPKLFVSLTRVIVVVAFAFQ